MFTLGPLTVQGILSLIEVAIAEEPKIAAELKTLLASNATPEDWAAARARVAAMTYEGEVPNTSLPKQ